MQLWGRRKEIWQGKTETGWGMGWLTRHTPLSQRLEQAKTKNFKPERLKRVSTSTRSYGLNFHDKIFSKCTYTRSLVRLATLTGWYNYWMKWKTIMVYFYFTVGSLCFAQFTKPSLNQERRPFCFISFTKLSLRTFFAVVVMSVLFCSSILGQANWPDYKTLTEL